MSDLVLQATMGSRKGLLQKMADTSETANGHVARNVRLTLMVVDIVEPYVRWSSPTLEMVSEELEKKVNGDRQNSNVKMVFIGRISLVMVDGLFAINRLFPR